MIFEASLIPIATDSGSEVVIDTKIWIIKKCMQQHLSNFSQALRHSISRLKCMWYMVYNVSQNKGSPKKKIFKIFRHFVQIKLL